MLQRNKTVTTLDGGTTIELTKQDNDLQESSSDDDDLSTNEEEYDQNKEQNFNESDGYY